VWPRCLAAFFVNPLRQPSVSQKVSVCYREREFDAIWGLSIDMSMWIIQALRWVRFQLKRVPGLQKAVQAIKKKTGLQTHADNQWARIVMNQETDRLVRTLDWQNASVLEISGQKWKNFGFRSYRSVDFPEHDLCSGALDEKFDIIIVEQVFEHLLWPYRAVRNVLQMLKPNGAFLISTPFLVKIHNSPVDCSRWTELGLRHLLAEGGFDIKRITTGSWGNRACIRSNWWKWTIYRPWLHSLKNEPEFPCHVWALARK